MSKNDETKPAQPIIDSGLKALYAAAGITDLLAERFREYAEAKQEEARSRRAKAREQFTHATERAQEMMTTAPQLAHAWPEQVQKQLDDMLKELNLSFDEMVRRGEERLQDLRHAAGSQTRKAASKVADVAEDVADEGPTPTSAAHETVVESIKTQDEPTGAVPLTDDPDGASEGDVTASDFSSTGSGSEHPITDSAPGEGAPEEHGENHGEHGS